MSNPTREQVEVILSRYWGGDGTVRVAAATNSLMALLADHRVLATGTTTSWDCGCFHAPDSHRPECTWTENPRSLLMVLLPVEPGTAVAVTARDEHRPKPLAIARFESRHGRIPPGAVEPETEWVMLRVDDGQENLHIDGEYAVYRRTEGPDVD